MKKMKMKKKIEKEEKRVYLYFARDGHDVLVRTAGWYCAHSTVCHGYCSSCINQQWNSIRGNANCSCSGWWRWWWWGKE